MQKFASVARIVPSVRVRVRVGLGSLLMYVKIRNMLKLRKTVMRPGKAKAWECSRNNTKRRIVQC